MNGKLTGKLKGGGALTPLKLRTIGRVALWALVALLLVRGAGAVISPTDEDGSKTEIGSRGASLDDKAAAFVVQFARTYISRPSTDAVAPFLADAASPPIRGKGSSGQEVAQAEVSGATWRTQSQGIVTVAVGLVDGRTLHLAVPIQTDSGRAAVTGAPYFVPGTVLPAVPGEPTEPVSGADAGAINELVGKFVATYVSAPGPGDLAYFLAPGATVTPLGGAFTVAGSPRTTQVETEDPLRRTVLASARVTDETSGATYPTGYRLDLVKRDRWYVSSVEGVAR